MTDAFYLRTLGGLSLHREGPEGEVLLGTSKSLAVLAYVALAPGREVRRRHLAALLWPTSEPKRARRSLRQALYYLSKQAGAELLRSDEGTVRVAEDRVEVDLWAFDRALERGDPERAVDLYGGSFLAGFAAHGGREFEGWMESQTERVWAGLKAAYHELVVDALETGRPDRAVRFAGGYAEVNPLDEKARRMLIRAHLAAGDRVQAYRAYEAYRVLLREELDAEPAPELRDRMETLRDEIFAGPTEMPRDAPGEPAPGAGPGRAAGEDEGHGPATPGPAGASERDEPLPGALTTKAGGRSRKAPPGSDVGDPASDGEGPGDAGTWQVAAVAAVTGFLAAVAAFALLDAPAADAVAGWEGADGRLLVATVGSPDRTEVTVRGGEATARRSGERDALVGPEGRRVARRMRTEGGVDLVVLDRESGDTLARADRTADELPLDWAPDGSAVLFRSGEPAEDGAGYRWTFEVLDVESGTRRDLGVTSRGAAYPRGGWSPTGARIAVSARGPDGWDVWVVDADGTGPRRITDHDADDRRPSWSPDGAWLAFDSDRGSTRDLYLVRPDGTGLERLTHAPEDEVGAAWLTDRHLAYGAGSGRASAGDGKRDLWLLDVPTRRTRRLERDLGVLWARRAPDAGLRNRRIAEVRITGPGSRVCPGQEVRLEARVVTRGGEVVPRATLPVRWTVSDSSVLRLDAGGTGTVRGEGTTTVVASAGGWRADTLRLRARQIEARPRPVLLSESWSSGIEGERWRTFGRPTPGVQRLDRAPPPGASGSGSGASGPRGAAGGGDTDGPAERGPAAAFVNNGDENYDSGVVSRARLPLADGLTVEFAARLPFSGRRYETVRVRLVRGLAGSDAPELALPSSRLGELLWVSLRGSDAGPLLWSGEDRRDLPVLSEPGSWHRYALQLEPGGRVSWVVDGRMRWRSGEALLSDPPDSARLAIGGRSLHADLLVGPVTVYRGARYGLERQPEE